MFTNHYDAEAASLKAKRLISRVDKARKGSPIDWQTMWKTIPNGEEWELATLAGGEDTSNERSVLQRFIAEIYATEGKKAAEQKGAEQKIAAFT